MFIKESKQMMSPALRCWINVVADVDPKQEMKIDLFSIDVITENQLSINGCWTPVLTPGSMELVNRELLRIYRDDFRSTHIGDEEGPST